MNFEESFRKSEIPRKWTHQPFKFFWMRTWTINKIKPNDKILNAVISIVLTKICSETKIPVALPIEFIWFCQIITYFLFFADKTCNFRRSFASTPCKTKPISITFVRQIGFEWYTPFNRHKFRRVLFQYLNTIKYCVHKFISCHSTFWNKWKILAMNMKENQKKRRHTLWNVQVKPLACDAFM